MKEKRFCNFFSGDSFIDVTIILQFLNYSKSIFYYYSLALIIFRFLALNHIQNQIHMLHHNNVVLFNVLELFL